MNPTDTRSASDDMEKDVQRRHFFKRLLAIFTGGAVLGIAGKAHAEAQSNDPFIGEIILFAGNFAPRGWAFCEGQLLSIASNSALFSILGTTYGGDGRTTFALPDLRGRVPLGPGTGPGLSTRALGQRSGQENVTLTTGQLPSHTHTANAHAGNGSSDNPTGLLPAQNPAGIPEYAAGANAALAANAIGNTGSSQAHNNMQPFLGLNYIIALVGTFPSRN
jgi:microcystin-dependent protein